MENVFRRVWKMKSLKDGFSVDETKGHSALFRRLKPGSHIAQFTPLIHSECHLDEEPLALMENNGRTPP
jgi:hypothetical protein